MNRISARLFLIRSLALCGAISAALLLAGLAAAADPPSAKIRVISYNVQFLPGPGRVANKRPNLPYRAATLGKEMSKFDIVGLNETFDDEPRELLLKSLKEVWGDDYHVAVHPRPDGPDDKRYNGGLLIASRFPILESHHTYYTQFSLPKDYGFTADGFAAKGVLHARVLRSKDAPKDDYIDVFTTHLEARADKYRPSQYVELAAFVKQHSDPGHPTLIMGDMNTHGYPKDQKDPASDYNLMLKTFSDGRPGAKIVDLWPSLKGEERGGTSSQESTEKGNRIDYIFFSNPGAKGPRLKPLDVRVNFFLDKEVVALSDHSAVEGDFEWEPAN